MLSKIRNNQDKSLLLHRIREIETIIEAQRLLPSEARIVGQPLLYLQQYIEILQKEIDKYESIKNFGEDTEEVIKSDENKDFDCW